MLVDVESISLLSQFQEALEGLAEEMAQELGSSRGLPGGEVGMGRERRFQMEGTECAGGKRYRGVFKTLGLISSILLG